MRCVPMLPVLLLAALLAACGQPPTEDLTETLVADPVRLKALRAQCATDRQAVGEDACRAAAEAFRRRFFAGHTSPDEYDAQGELPPIPPSFDTPGFDMPIDDEAERDAPDAAAPEATP
ncbi:hypothetical protein I5G49_14190 [Pseudomonas aeruginosa]|uniref:hypothetical protein n=1 Tax=Pseudomonadaceae TaxID=135621 RepID=UPI00162A8E90|nr:MULTISPECIES: hypothetical protein [Pseudomonadaceae]MBG7303407.1 hypothetical protein [Pseudomonas aeruginosa]MDH0184718.1 hypothetical protein [Stutzerimonas stutzeri]MDH1249131.1 hypothetical protein [Stutzerimonas stutzeri]HBP6433501.1 hypothetical protein [Pseudomonas aeruginosa]